MGIYKTSLPHRPDGVIGFTSSCPAPPTFYNKLAPMCVVIGALISEAKSKAQHKGPIQHRA